MTTDTRNAYWRTLDEILALPVTYDCCPWEWLDEEHLTDQATQPLGEF